MITLRVYDSASVKKEYATCTDRYTLYVPTPRNKVREWGYMGTYLGFSFTDEVLIKCCWGECENGVRTMSLGRKVKRETLPMHVQKWIDKLEKAYNKAITENTEEAWEEWGRA